MSSWALWLCIVLLIGSAAASDVPFVFDDTTSGVTGYTSSQLEQAYASYPGLAGVPAVTPVAEDEILYFPITGGGNLPNGTTEKKVSDLKTEFDARVEPENSRVNDEALVLALKYPGDLTIDQIVSIYSYLKNGDDTKSGWGYVRDPRGIDYLRYANATLKAGDKANCVGGGDCDDFSILMGALVESVGGTTRIILARNNTTGGHAYTEVYLGRINDTSNQVEDIINWLKERFDTDKIYTHIDTDTKDVWLNLDWGSDENGNTHPGGPFYQGERHIVLCIRDKFVKTPLKLPETPHETSQANQLSSNQQTIASIGTGLQKWNRTFGREEMPLVANLTSIICEAPGEQSHTAVGGNDQVGYYVVWMDNRTGNPDIYGYSLSQELELPMAGGIYEDMYPDIEGSIIAWISRNPLNQYNIEDYWSIRTFDIAIENSTELAYGLEAAAPIFLSQDYLSYLRKSYFGWMVYVRPLYEKEVTLDFPPSGINQRSGGDITVYQDNKKGSWDVWMWKIGSEPVALASDSSDQINPATDGKTVVWQDNRNGNWDIYAYDLNTSQELQITSDLFDQIYPDIDNGEIVWQDNRNGNWDLYVYIVNKQMENTICTDEGNQTRPRINTGRIVWEDDRKGDKDIYIYQEYGYKIMK